MTYKPLTGLTLVVILATLFTGCFGEGPKDVADKYLKASIRFDIEEGYQYLSTAGKAEISLEKAIAEHDQTKNSPLGPLLDVALERTTFTIDGVEIAGDTAKVTYTITQPDPRPVLEDQATLALVLSASDDKEKLRKVIEERLNEDDIKMEIETDTLKMVKENGVWKVASPVLK